MIISDISDHFLIYAVNSFKLNWNTFNDCFTYRFFSHLNEELFKDDLMNAPWDSLNDIDENNVALDTWVSLFMNVVECTAQPVVRRLLDT